MGQTSRLKDLMIRASEMGIYLFRNNVAKAWQGRGKPLIIKKTESVLCNPGDVVLRKARVIHSGLIKGSSDLIGYEQVKITEEMVGEYVAIFVGVEDKSAKDKESPEQVAFKKRIREAGGKAIVAMCVDDLDQLK